MMMTVSSNFCIFSKQDTAVESANVTTGQCIGIIVVRLAGVVHLIQDEAPSLDVAKLVVLKLIAELVPVKYPS